MTKTRIAVLAVAGTVGLLMAFGPGLLTRTVAGSLNQTVDVDYPEPSAEAQRIHDELMVADLHADALLWDRDLLKRAEYGHVDFPRMVEGRVGLQAFTAVTKTPSDMNIDANTGDTDQIRFLAIAQAWPPRTWSSLTERAVHQADKLAGAAERSADAFVIIRTAADLTSFMARRERESEAALAGFLGIEGAHALEGDLANVDRLFEAGYRMFGLTHFFDNEVGGSAHGVERGGLTGFGHDVLDRMDELGIAVDVAHAAPALIDAVLDRATRPVLVSHTGLKGTCDNQRNLDDERLRRIAATGGVVGIGLWGVALCGETPKDWARAVRHGVTIAGVDHIGIGSDWDGAVTTMIDASGTVHLTAALMDEGFTPDEIARIMGGNVVRALSETLPPGGS